MFDEFDKTFGGVFPSPIGELHFSILRCIFTSKCALFCFRPLSGSYISQSDSDVRQFFGALFPSPIGELHFSIMSLFFSLRLYQVSVPYRGATFLNAAWTRWFPRNSFRPLSGSYISQYTDICRQQNWYSCFRPLSGSYISQSGLHCCYKLQLQFPSPIGELHFSIKWGETQWWKKSFPSPIGELHFSINHQRHDPGR